MMVTYGSNNMVRIIRSDDIIRLVSTCTRKAVIMAVYYQTDLNDVHIMGEMIRYIYIYMYTIVKQLDCRIY